MKKTNPRPREKFTEAKAQQKADAADAADDDSSIVDKDGKEGRSPSSATLLVDIGRRCELFHDQRGNEFARVCIGEHLETWPLRSKSFKTWLAREFYQHKKRTAGSQAISDALNVLVGDAQFEGPERTLYVRVAKDAQEADVLWYDLGNEKWQAIRIAVNGWQIVNDPPTLFRRHSVMSVNRHAIMTQF